MQFFHLNVFSQIKRVGSPLGQLGEDLVHGRVLLSHIVNDVLDDLVLLALLLQVLAGVLLGNLSLEAVCSDFVVTLAHRSKLVILVGKLGSVQLCVK